MNRDINDQRLAEGIQAIADGLLRFEAEIERLRAENMRLPEASEEIARLQKALDTCRELREWDRAEIGMLKRRIAELEK